MQIIRKISQKFISYNRTNRKFGQKRYKRRKNHGAQRTIIGELNIIFLVQSVTLRRKRSLVTI